MSEFALGVAMPEVAAIRALLIAEALARASRHDVMRYEASRICIQDHES
jgi:hypothetical protein